MHATRAELTVCWNLLHDACSNEEREHFADVLAEHIEALDIAHSPLGRLGLRWSEMLEKRLPCDHLLMRLITAGRKLKMPFADFLPTVETIYQKAPPRVVSIHDIVLAELDPAGENNSELSRLVVELRHQAFNRSRASDDAFPRPQCDLNGWV